jgi:cytochrome c oxidase accessory protein FixG
MRQRSGACRQRAGGAGGGAADDLVAMYQPHEKVYPRETDGRFQRLRRLAMFLLLGFYYLTPWIQWDGRQSILFDLPARKFYVFGLTFWPQDFFFLAMLLIMAGLSLFFFTALAGRLWCGYACPQTVWTDAFLMMERWAEGDRAKRMKLDAAPWTVDKLRRKAAKHTMWIVFALWTGFTFVGYFTPVRQLGAEVMDFSLGPWESFWLFFYSFATWGNAGFLREQVCIYMCPYARFQSAMFDRDTLIVSYDARRGDPRGARARSVDHAAAGLGDCIDCTLCVQVCPTGIDIRDGLQYECIACGACADVCDTVMDRMGYEHGLVRYATEHEMDGEPARVLRPRMIIYGTLLTGLFVAWMIGISNRTPLRVDLLHDRNVLYQQTDEGIENVYTMKLSNMREEPRRFDLTATGLDGLRITGVEGQVEVAAGSVVSIPMRLVAPETAVDGLRNDVIVRVCDSADASVCSDAEARFIGPDR